MAKLENTFKKYLVRIMGTRWDAQSHEDSLSTGIPDMSFGIGGHINGWMELKQIKAWPKLEKTLVKPEKYTPSQVNWLLCRGKAGGNCWVFVRVGTNEYFLFHYSFARSIAKGMLRADYERFAVGFWKGSVDPQQLADFLSRKSFTFCQEKRPSWALPSDKLFQYSEKDDV